LLGFEFSIKREERIIIAESFPFFKARIHCGLTVVVVGKCSPGGR
jgi:hypothetical protein